MTLRWGILGAARIAANLIPAIRAAGGEVVLLGARDPGADRVKAFADRWQIPEVGHYRDVVEADLDAVYNPLPNHLHRPWSEAAMRAGKHVLTEKPLSLNAAEAQELADVAAQTKRVLLEAFAYRFTAHHLAMMESVQSGELGELRMFQGAFGFPLTRSDDFRWDASMGGGSLYDVGCYPVNLARLLLGEPLAVSAQARWTPGGVDLALSGTLDYAPAPDGSGASASIQSGFDWLQGGMLGRALIVGTRGQLELDRAYISEETEFRLTVNGQARTLAPANGYTGMVRHFQRVVSGQEEALYPPTDAVRQARVLDALLLSAREGRRVAL